MKNNDEFNRLQVAFGKASQLNGHDRSDFVEEWERRDSELAEELRALLHHHDSDKDPLESACKARQRAITSLLDTEVGPPTVAGYKVLRKIGNGGQADVYLAHQESTGQRVAIKVFHGLGLNESQKRHIDDETRALVRLQLPNVVPILDRGVTETGREYLVTRYVEGDPIDRAASRLLAEGPEQVFELFAKVAETLGRVHRHGIIHRDLKPSNILVDREGEPYLLDFGLAGFFVDQSGRVLATTPQPFQGSIRWASPEQVDSSFGEIDSRSDLYSLGVVLYQSLTGRFPYPVKGGLLNIAEQIVCTRPDPLYDQSGTSQTELTSAMESTVLHSLAKRRERRFQSAGELATALRSVAEVCHSDETVIDRHSKNRFAWLSVTAIGILLVGILSFIIVGVQTVDSTDDSTLTLPGMLPVITPDETDPSDDKVIDSTPDIEPSEDMISDGSSDLIHQFDVELLPFGKVPADWKQIGKVENNHHEIGRDGIDITGDFSIWLSLSASRTDQARFTLTLVGHGSSDDLQISGTKTNTFSDNEQWKWQTPGEDSPTRGLPIGLHTFILKRRGDIYTLSADAVARQQRNSPVLSTFAVGDRTRFQAIRISTSGPMLRLKQLRLHCEEATQVEGNNS